MRTNRGHLSLFYRVHLKVGLFILLLGLTALTALPNAQADGRFSLYLGMPGVIVERGYPPPTYNPYPDYPPRHDRESREIWVPGQWVWAHHAGWIWQPGFWQAPRRHHHHHDRRDDDRHNGDRD